MTLTEEETVGSDTAISRGHSPHQDPRGPARSYPPIFNLISTQPFWPPSGLDPNKAFSVRPSPPTLRLYLLSPCIQCRAMYFTYLPVSCQEQLGSVGQRFFPF